MGLRFRVFHQLVADFVNQRAAQSLYAGWTSDEQNMQFVQPLNLYTAPERDELQGAVHDRNQDLDRFLATVERQAFRTAVIATRNEDDAFDIVQDAMIKLVEKYAHKPEAEWRPLFFTILHSRITDYHRKRSLTSRLFQWLGPDDEDDVSETGESLEGPVEKMMEALTIDRLLAGLDSLSTRQQQVFLLRVWQGFSVAETASILKCSEGSVKTHLARAMSTVMKTINQDDQDD